MNLKNGSPANSISVRISLSRRAISALVSDSAMTRKTYHVCVQATHASQRAAPPGTGDLQLAGRKDARRVLLGHVFQPGPRDSRARRLPSARADASLPAQRLGAVRD